MECMGEPQSWIRRTGTLNRLLYYLLAALAQCTNLRNGFRCIGAKGQASMSFDSYFAPSFLIRCSPRPSSSSFTSAILGSFVSVISHTSRNAIPTSHLKGDLFPQP